MENEIPQATVQESSEPSLTISATGLNYLNETGKWTKFLSIVGFVLIGLFVVMAFFAGTMMSIMSGGQMDNAPQGMGFLFGGMYLLMGLLYFFPIWYLFNFSQKLKSALSTKSSDELSIALLHQKSFYKFWGIVMIITIGFYVVFGLVGFIATLLK